MTAQLIEAPSSRYIEDAMTQRYTHVLPSLMQDAAAAMDRALGS